MKAATKWNEAHPDLVAEFNKLTGGKCAGQNAGVSVRAIRQWQRERAPEIGKKLIQEYGDPQNAERALVDALLERAGIEGVRFHRGKEGKGKGKGDQSKEKAQGPEDPEK